MPTLIWEGRFGAFPDKRRSELQRTTSIFQKEEALWRRIQNTCPLRLITSPLLTVSFHCGYLLPIE